MIDNLLALILKIAYTAVALGILIFVHELGHFLVAKRAGIRVERFSLGYPPKMFGVRWGETEYCLSWIPFGGYVKVAGMADVGSEAATGAPWEFSSKPLGIRMAVIAAGPLMNFAFAFLLFTGLIAAVGVETSANTAVAPAEGSAAARAGLQPGDVVRRVGDRAVGSEFELERALERAGGRPVSLQVERAGALLAFDLPAARDAHYDLDTFYPTLVGRVVDGMPAAALDLETGDRIVAVAGVPVASWAEMSAEISRHPGQTIQLQWERDGQLMESPVTPAVNREGDRDIGRIGIGPLQDLTRAQVDLVEAASLGAGSVYNYAWVIVDFIGGIFHGDRYKQLGGPVRIMEMAAETAEMGLDYFLNFLGLLSVNLAILNLLPIPVLDGGHLAFLALEGAMRRPLSLRQREFFQQIGLAIILFIMVLVTFNDLNQLVFHHIVEMFQ
ncbi:MAG: RIP metalloprotease RseP [Gemmatimonadota bacterium]